MAHICYNTRMDFKPNEFTGVVFDSRKVKPGCLFAALPGATVDGHAFVRQAFEKGAKGLLVRADRAAAFTGPERSALIPVPDVKASLTETARTYRRTLKAKVIGITGSAGKTTVKEFTAAFLRQSQMDLGEFIAGVATPGGTTAAGMDVMRASDFGQIVVATLKAAADRSAELGK